MTRRLILIGVLTCLCGCSSTAAPQNQTGKLLCIRSIIDGNVHTDCLDALNATEPEVQRRVALYNEGKSKDEKIRCVYRKRLGTTMARWKCARTNRSFKRSMAMAFVIDQITVAP